jgi:N-acetylmuramate 1-kinase
MTAGRGPDSLTALAREAGMRPCRVEPLTGDVGRRRYFRLHLATDATAVGVLYDEAETEMKHRWMAVREAFSGSFRVPEVLADDGAACQIVEDFGPTPLSARLTTSPAEQRLAWLKEAATTAGRLGGVADPAVNAPFDAPFFVSEMDRAREALFDRWQGRPLTAGEADVFRAFAKALAEEIAHHPRRLLHRDFHGDNLFAVDGAVGIIDFQDARQGPDTYDLASLLYERTTLDWMDEETAARTVEAFSGQSAIARGAVSDRLCRVLLQRALKAAGTFAAVVASGRPGPYRTFLPRQLRLVRRLLSESPEERDFARVFDLRLAKTGA